MNNWTCSGNWTELAVFPNRSISQVLGVRTWMYHFGGYNSIYSHILEKAMAPHSSTLAWEIPWTEEPGRLQSMGLLESDTTERLHFHFSLSCIGERNGNPLQCSCLENPRDGGACWAAVSGVTHSWTWLKRLSSSGRWSVNACQFKWREWFDYIAQTFSKCLSSMDCGQDAIVCSSPEEESSHRILINV